MTHYSQFMVLSRLEKMGQLLDIRNIINVYFFQPITWMVFRKDERIRIAFIALRKYTIISQKNKVGLCYVESDLRHVTRLKFLLVDWLHGLSRWCSMIDCSPIIVNNIILVTLLTYLSDFSFWVFSFIENNFRFELVLLNCK